MRNSTRKIIRMKTKMLKRAKSNFICFVTCPNYKQAKKIASSVVKENLSACVNIIKIAQSIYKWKGRISNEGEFLLIMKGHYKNRSMLAERIRSLHSYEVPEIIFTKIDSGYDKYLDWISKIR